MTKSRNGSTRAWRVVRARVLARDERRCRLRGPGCTGRADTVDHIVPVSRGGSDRMENLRAACGHCNYSRGNGNRVSDPRPGARQGTPTQVAEFFNPRNRSDDDGSGISSIGA